MGGVFSWAAEGVMCAATFLGSLREGAVSRQAPTD